MRFLAKNDNFGQNHNSLKMDKIFENNDQNMVGTVFDRSQCGFYEINNCINKMQFFMLFWNKNGNISFADLVEFVEFHDYRLGYKKAQISNFS